MSYTAPPAYNPEAEHEQAYLNGSGGRHKGFAGNPAGGMMGPGGVYDPEAAATGAAFAARSAYPQATASSAKAPGSGLDSDYLSFQNKAVRHGFIRKVYGILTVQLLLTFGTAALFTYTRSIRDYVQDNMWTFWLAWVVTLVCVIAIACGGELRRKVPTNYILLTTFTVAEAYLVGIISSFYESDSVVIAAGMTAAITFGLTLFACQTKLDFTMMGGMLFSFLMALLLLGIVNIFIHSKFLYTLYAAGGALLFSAYIVYDTQIIVGQGKYSISPDEYILGALMLYLDIINLFLMLLRLFGRRR